MNDTDEIPEALLLPAARAYRRLCGSMQTYPDWWDRKRAIEMIEALRAEHLKVVPADIDEDLIRAEEGI